MVENIVISFLESLENKIVAGKIAKYHLITL